MSDAVDACAGDAAAAVEVEPSARDDITRAPAASPRPTNVGEKSRWVSSGKATDRRHKHTHTVHTHTKHSELLCTSVNHEEPNV